MDAACQGSLSITNYWSLLKLMSIISVKPSIHLILCRPLLLPPSIFPSMRDSNESNESVLCMRWPKYWSFSFSISPSNEPPGLISFRMGWLDLLAVQGTLKSLLQQRSSKVSILWHSAFFIVSHIHSRLPVADSFRCLAKPILQSLKKKKLIALTTQSFVGKLMSLLF